MASCWSPGIHQKKQQPPAQGGSGWLTAAPVHGATWATSIRRALFHKLLPRTLSAVWNVITGYPSSPKVSQFNLAPFPLQQHISSIALPRWDGSTNLPVPRLATSQTLKSCRDPWSNILSLQLRGPPPSLMTLPQPLPSHSLPGTPPWILMLSLHCTPSVILDTLLIPMF